METFTKLFGSLLVFVYHCFDRIVIHGYLPLLSRPEQVVYFFREVHGRCGGQQGGAEPAHRRVPGLGGGLRPQSSAFPSNGPEKGVRKEDYVRPGCAAWSGRSATASTSSSRAWSRARRSASRVPKYPDQGSQLPHPGAAAQPLHPLLLLHPRRGPRPDGHARGLVLPVPDHLLPQRPSLHRAGTEPAPGSASAKTTTPFSRSTIRRRCRPPPTG